MAKITATLGYESTGRLGMGDFGDMDGLQVLWHLLTTEPFFWFILSIGFLALLLSLWVDRWEDNEHIKHYDDTHHINR